MIMLKNESVELLLYCLKKHKPDLQWVIESQEFFALEPKLGNELREAVGDELIENGFDGDVCTSYGWKLEYLIDEIGNLFMQIGQTGLNTYGRTYFNDGNVATENSNEYSYDGMSRLSSENNTDFTFDIFSNRETKDNTSYTYDKNNRLLSDSSSSYLYDDNGNRLTKGNSSYSWDSFNRLISADGITYTYDGHGLMQTKTDSSGTTRFIWDGANIVAEVTAENIVTYSRGLRLISRDDGTTKEYYHFNPHGDVVNLTNASGTTTATYTYDAFGNITSQTGSSTNNFKYCGEWSDSNTGLLYLRMRWYDPETGQFISEDPAKDGLNWYAYCGGNPITFVDPWGLEQLVVSGGAYQNGKGYQYEFVDSALLWIKEMIEIGHDEDDITWLVADAGWTDTQKNSIIEAAANLGVSLRWFNDIYDLIGYLNTGGKDGRKTDKITSFASFSHGFEDSTISYGYDYSSPYNKELNFTKNLITILNPYAFNKTYSVFYSCNTAKGGEDSFAHLWTQATKGTTWAVDGKTNYEEINTGGFLRQIWSAIGIGDRAKWKNNRGSYDNAGAAYQAPSLGKGAKWKFLKY